MEINTFLKATIFIVAFSSCKVTYPKTENDCVIESKRIIKIVSDNNYITKLRYLKKYEMFKNYKPTDYQKSYEKLHDYLVNNGVNSLNLHVSRDTLTIVGLDSRVSYFELNFSTRTETEEKSICKLHYSISKEDSYYTLSYFKHSLNNKMQPILPKN